MSNANQVDTRGRRRIVQLPSRTEAPLSLIGRDGELPEGLEARLKQAYPLLVFPSLSHFLAEPPRRWAGLVITRTGAWDARLDQQVKTRSRIALYGDGEEGYGWPEQVARVRTVEELEPWLAALNAPEPVLKRISKSGTRARDKADREDAARASRQLSMLEPNTPSASSEEAAPAQPSEATASAPATPKAPRAAGASQRPAARGKTKPTRGERPATAATRGVQPRASRKARVPRAQPMSSAPAPRSQPAAPTPVSQALAPAAAPIRPAANRSAEFTRIAAELGLARAFELLEIVRQRALEAR